MSRKKVIQAVSEYARQVLYEPLGLWGWEIHWKLEPCEDECYAQVNAVEHRRCASVYVCGDFEKLPPHEIHMVLTHELIHLLHRDQTDTIRLGACQAGMATAAYDVLHELFRVQTELMVDHLTDRFCALIPIDKKLMKAITEQGTKG